ncbi:MAG: SMC-Scp complex subunit ScpB [Pyramidobacter sp.]|jgi:segregation and condensation protein B
MSSLPHETDDLLLQRQVEAILFTGTDGVTPQELSLATERPASAVRAALQKLSAGYAAEHGMEVVELGGRWFMTTAADLHDTLEKFRSVDESEHVRLTRASLETLAIIAYSQPVTRSEIESIRGVRCDRVIDTLLNYGLARIAGRRKSTGSPLLYRTTKKFLEIFGLGGISELPTIAEIEELRQHDGEESGAEATPLSSDERNGDGASLADDAEMSVSNEAE